MWLSWTSPSGPLTLSPWPPHCAMLPRAHPVLTAAHKAFGGHQIYVLRGPGVRAQGPSGQTAHVRLAGHSACCASGSSSVRHDASSTHLMGPCGALGSSPGWRWCLSLCDWAAGVSQVGRLTSLHQADAYLPVSGHVDSAWYRHIGNCPWSQGPELSPGDSQAWHSPARPTGHPMRAGLGPWGSLDRAVSAGLEKWAGCKTTFPFSLSII